MTAYGPGDQSDPSAYGGPPPTGQPQYPTSQPQYPAYPPQYPVVHGYPPAPGYGYGPPGYPGYPAYPAVAYPVAIGPRRPGTATAAAVLAFVNGGLLILAGALLVFGGSLATDLEDATNSSTRYGTELVFDGFVNFLAAGLLIAGGVSLLGGKAVGRTMLGIGGAIVLTSAVYWLTRFNHIADSGFVTWVVIFSALTVISLSLMAGGTTSRWVRQQP